MSGSPGTWHYGLVARWWAEFNTASEEELARFGRAIDTYGQPALDLGCGAGRLLLPLLGRGVDVEGVDVSGDMLEWCLELGRRAGLAPRVHRQALHELELDRRFRTIYGCGVFGIGGDRSNDLEALRRARRHLEPGGALVFDHWLPYEGKDEAGWARWLPSGRVGLPKPWQAEGDRRPTADGDEIEIMTRLAELDPLLQRHAIEIRARLWQESQVVREEQLTLLENLYFVPEIRLMLDVAGFAQVDVEGGYGGRPAAPDDGMVVFVARA